MHVVGQRAILPRQRRDHEGVHLEGLCEDRRVLRPVAVGRGGEDSLTHRGDGGASVSRTAERECPGGDLRGVPGGRRQRQNLCERAVPVPVPGLVGGGAGCSDRIHSGGDEQAQGGTE